MEEGNSIVESAEQFEKTLSPSEVMVGDNVTDFKAMQLQNADVPIESTVEGIVIDRIFLHPEKADCPIEVMICGNKIESSFKE